MLSAIERATRQKIERLQLPTTETVNNKRIADFKQKISDTLAGGEMTFMQNLVEQYRNEHDVPALDIAAALAKMSIGDKPLLLSADKERKARDFDKEAAPRGKKRHDRTIPELDSDKQRYRIEVGHEHGVKPGNIVGAIANEAGLAGDHIGSISIDQEFSLVDLPAGMPKDIFMDLRKVRVCGRPMNISIYGKAEKPSRSSPGKKDFGKKDSGKKGFGKKDFGKKGSGKKAPGKKAPSKRTAGKLSLGSKASAKAKHRKGTD